MALFMEQTQSIQSNSSKTIHSYRNPSADALVRNREGWIRLRWLPMFLEATSLRTNSSAGQEAKKDRKNKEKKRRAWGGNGRREGNSLWEKRYMASGLESISHRPESISHGLESISHRLESISHRLESISHGVWFIYILDRLHHPCPNLFSAAQKWVNVFELFHTRSSNECFWTPVTFLFKPVLS